MSFTQATFAPLSGQASDTVKIYAYKTSDPIATVTATNYFSDKIFQLDENDLIFAEVSEGTRALIIGADNSTATLATGLTGSADTPIDDIAAGETTYTTSGNIIVVCLNTATATVTLNTSPFDGEQATFSRRSGSVVLSGTINGESSVTLNSIYTSIHLIYSASAGEWVIL
jgi:hypothetical protein